jgi:sarcosine oxidase
VTGAVAGPVERVDVVVVGLGALGSATAWHLARRGTRVVGLEQFALGHPHGASHDTSRILRRSYHTAAYVRLAGEAYADWADLSAAAGEELVTTTGGLDLFPPGAVIPAVGYVESMRACGVPFTELDAAEVERRWPALALPPGTTALHQADTAVVPAGRTARTLQRLAVGAGARLREQAPVVSLAERADGTVAVTTAQEDGATTYVADRVVLTADAWTNDLLAHLGTSLPLTVTREQVTYFAPAEPARFVAERLPVWIWMDDPSFYGFPTYDEGGTARWVKAAQDCGGAVTTAATRSYDVDEEALRRLRGFVGPLLPGVGDPARTVTCLYTLTPDRDFVVGPLPDRPSVLVGLGAGHAFKFAPTVGRVLADLVTAGATVTDIAAFAPDRPALAEAGHPVSWLV